MKEDKRVKLFLVDDDLLFLKALEIEFQSQGLFSIETFSTGEDCLLAMDHHPDVIILDYHLNGINKQAMNGIAVLDKIKAVAPNTHVIMLSSQDSIAVAIECMHHQAADYVVKSETSFIRLKAVLTSVFQLHEVEAKLQWYMTRM